MKHPGGWQSNPALSCRGSIGAASLADARRPGQPRLARVTKPSCALPCLLPRGRTVPGRIDNDTASSIAFPYGVLHCCLALNGGGGHGVLLPYW